MASRARSGGRAAVAATGRGRDQTPAGRTSGFARVLTTHPHRTAAGLFALLVFAYLWPALVGGRLLAPLAELLAITPWHTSAPAGFARYVNPALSDVPLSYYPWDVLARQLLHAGTFPAWNPHALAGTPLFANDEVAWLSPFSLPLWILPLNYGFGVAAALKLWVAGFGTYLLARELRLGFWPGVLAGISFMLCGFNVIRLTYGVFIGVAALLPWAIWLIERIVRRGGAAAGLGLAGVVATLLAGGHPGTQLHVVAAAVLYGLMRTGLSTDVATRERLRRLALIGGGLVVGALLAAVVLLPVERAAIGTAGAAARSNGGVGLPGAAMPPGILRTALFPDWWGRPAESFTGGPAPFFERTFYAGAVALILAVVALVSRTGWRRTAPFVLLGAIGLAVPIHGSGLHELVNHLPLFDRVQDQRMLLWFELAVAVLAAFGLQAVLDAPRRQRRAWAVIAGAAAAGLVAVALLPIHGDTLGSAIRYIGHRTHTATSAVLALAATGWWLVFVAALAAILLLARRLPQRRRLIGGLVALVAALDMLHFAHGDQPMGPASKVMPPLTPAIAFLQRHTAGGERIAGLNSALTSDWSTVYGLRDARGYDAPQPSLRFDRLWHLINPEQSETGGYVVPGLSQTSLVLLGMLGVRYFVTPSFVAVRSSELPLVYQGRDANVYANTLAMPRAIVASRVDVALDEAAELRSVRQQSFDPRRTAIVRRREVAGAAPLGAGPGATVRVVGEQNAAVTLHAMLPRAGLVVLDDAWAPGWSVRVDGRPAEALQADVVLRGVVVPAGRHDIVWSYHVPGLRLGATLSALGLLLAFGWGGWLVVRLRRRPSADPLT
jgi:hypothetical protein